MNFDATIRKITFIKTAKPLVAAAKTEVELTRAIAENPNNKSLRTLGVGLENASATRKRVAELYANSESVELKQLNKTLDALIGVELVPIARSIRSAQWNARDAANSLPGI